MEPSIVKDINPGSSSSGPTDLTNVNGTLYFSANDGTNGKGVWKSDGTAAGTTLVKNIYPEYSGIAPSSLTNVNGTLYFVSYYYYAQNMFGVLWKSDGTTAGTTPFAGTGTRRGGIPSAPLTNVNGTLYFSGSSSWSSMGPNEELWKTDTTTAGSTLVKDINPGSSGSFPRNLTNVNSTLYFTASDSPYAYGSGPFQLWKSDGTTAGTTPVQSWTGSRLNNPANLTNASGIFYFTATDSIEGTGLWKIDSINAGVTLVKKVVPPWSSDTNPANLTDVSGTLYFIATDSIKGTGLWKSDGTEGGTTLVKNISLGSGGFSSANLTNVNGTLYFVANDGTNGTELWKSDGTAAGTTLVKDINPGSSSSSLSNLTNVSGTLYFTTNDGINGVELWKSDGTKAGTTLVKDINPGSSGSDPQNLINIDETLYFTANDGTNGVELWKFDTPSKNQNDAPTIASAITNQIATEDATFTFQFDANTFSDYDAGDTLTYSATLENNKPLPSWLTFDAATRTFSGTPTYKDLGNLSIKVTAADSLGASVSDNFRLGIIPKGSLKGDGLQAVYYDNSDFTGRSVTGIDPTVNFNWVREGRVPAPGIQAYTFSARWTGQVQPLYSEDYTFYTQSDDGVRLWVNDQLLIDNWTDHSLTENKGSIRLVAGQKYDIKMEYYDNAIDATAKLLWSSASTAKSVIPQAQLYSNRGDGLQAVYYDNLNFAGPAVTQTNPTVDFNWGQGAPAPNIGADTFSARWTGQVQPLYSEDYTFYAQSDDGVRLWVNDQLLIDNWTDHSLTENSGTIRLQAGQKYNIKMEYYDNAVDATAKLFWSSASTPKAVIPQAQLYSSTPQKGDGLQAAYYNYSDFTGTAITQIDPSIDFNWGFGSPAPGIKTETFSARWIGQVQAQASEVYTFYTQSDDGVRLWINDQLLIDNWTNHKLTENSGTVALQAGQKYNIKMEFYDNIGSATAKLLWSSASTPKAVIPQSQLFSISGDGLQAASYDSLNLTGNTALVESAIFSSSNGSQTDALLGNQTTKANDTQLMDATSLAQSKAITSGPDLTWSIGSRGASDSGSQTAIQRSSLATGGTDLWPMNGTASNYSVATLLASDLS